MKHSAERPEPSAAAPGGTVIGGWGVVFCDANPEKADAARSVRAQYVDFIISAMNGIDFCKAKKKHANCQGFACYKWFSARCWVGNFGI